MADVLLTHSNHLAYDAKQLRKMQPYPPLGTLYAATALRAAGISVAVYDTTFNKPLPGFLEALTEHQPKIVVIYEDDFNFVTKMCLLHMRELANELSTIAHASGIAVVVHGSDATDHPQEYLDNGADFVLNGEAEQTLQDLCRSLLQDGRVEVEAVPGLVRYSAADGSLEKLLPAPKNPSWAALPRVERGLIDLEPYRRSWTEAHGYFSTNVVSSRGCPYGCNWCAKPISGNRFHLRAPEEVAAEMHELKTLFGVQHIWFGDDVFALDRHWIEQFANAVESYGEVVPFKIQSRADLMSEATVASLKRAGCAEIWMGVESGSQVILDAMNKGLKLSTVHVARERLAKAGIRACYFLQFGYPGEGWDEICETVQLVRDTRPDDIGVSLSYPLPGTGFFERVQAQLGIKRNWVDSDDLCTMHIASYTDSFYHALRDALHAEVAGWHAPADPFDASIGESLWMRVHEMEPLSRNVNVLSLPTAPAGEVRGAFVPLQELVVERRS
ncbi:radical SAM protein [Granulicella sp. dw_53]|uniref:B12-binding domain-containing radical SAM protein n=1 Tax=Granulicella sp. dw_53 TaxID=2719792 RepID=UPI001BD50DAA|nr:radical SAM protein [Granulicella sp. dw_53]